MSAVEPYGEVTATGSSTNPYQYTGRENDGTGLYYYRARYYSPSLKRFISEDPMGLDAGLNEYVYADGDPLDELDPLGLDPGGRDRGQSGGSSGRGTDNPYKHCKEDPTNPKMIICKDKDGKKIKKPKPWDWEKYKSECDSCEAVGGGLLIGGGGYLLYRCVRMIPSLFPPLWWTIPENAVAP